ncbi:hypothetical protein [Streptomyces cinereoruber]|uniref:hypothetical protein n=1 Tax=Streptomyces cinereoruber TaxID=67260 RepID=UPI00364501BF
MIPYIPADTRQLLLVACTATALTAGSLGWFAAQTVRPSCTYAMIAVGTEAEQEEAAERAYWQAVASGDCAPPHARWRFWLD